MSYTNNVETGLGRAFFFNNDQLLLKVKSSRLPCLAPRCFSPWMKTSLKLSNQVHLAYCTNVHRGNSWQETFDSLENYVMKVGKESLLTRGLQSGCDWEQMPPGN